VADGCQVVHVVMKEDGTIHLKKGDRSTWVGYKSDDKADQEWRAGCISRLLGHSGWDAAAPAAPAPEPLTDEQIDRVIEHSACWTGPGLGARFKKEVFARLIEKACAEAWGVKLGIADSKGEKA
jgi:hypothetical protein